MSSEKVEQFVQITGCTSETATNLLLACNDNLEMAVSLYMDDPNHAQQESSAPCRSPIPRRTEQLVPVDLPMFPEHVRRYTTRSRRAFLADDSDSESIDQGDVGDVDTLVTSNGIHDLMPGALDGPRNASRGAGGLSGVLDLTNGNADRLPSSSNDTRSRKRNHLVQLFQPPSALLFTGSLAAALAEARKRRRWLLLSLHDEECFDCHLLNRDVWKDPKMFQLVKKHFVFVQIPIDSPDGVHYRRAHPYVNSASHIAILDPFTEQQVVMWVHLKDPTHIHQVLSEFLQHHELDSNAEPSTFPLSASSACPSSSSSTADPPQLKRPRLDPASMELSARVASVSSQISDESPVTSSAAAAAAARQSARRNLLELSEEEQLRLAIEASKRELDRAESQQNNGDGASNGTLEDEEDEGEEEADSSDCFVVPSPSAISSQRNRDPVTLPEPVPGQPSVELLVRMPGGARELLTVPASLPLLDLWTYFASRGFDAGRYEMIRLYPRTCLSSLPGQTTLEQAGLVKKDTVFVQER